MTVRELVDEARNVRNLYYQEIYLRDKKRVITNYFEKYKYILIYPSDKPHLELYFFYIWDKKRELSIIENFNKMYEYEPITDHELYKKLLKEEFNKNWEIYKEDCEKYHNRMGYSYDKIEKIRYDVDELLEVFYKINSITPDSGEKKVGYSPEVRVLFNQIDSIIMKINGKLQQENTYTSPSASNVVNTSNNTTNTSNNENNKIDTSEAYRQKLLAETEMKEGIIKMFLVIGTIVSSLLIIASINWKSLFETKQNYEYTNKTIVKEINLNKINKENNNELKEIKKTKTSSLEELVKKVEENKDKSEEIKKRSEALSRFKELLKAEEFKENKKEHILHAPIKKLFEMAEENELREIKENSFGKNNEVKELINKSSDENNSKEKSNEGFLEKQKEIQRKIKEGKYSIDSKEREGKIIIENDLELSKCFGIDEKGDDELKLDVDTKCILERYYKNHKLDPMDFSDELKKAGRCIIDYHYNKNDVHMEVDHSCFKRIIERKIKYNQKQNRNILKQNRKINKL